jgi:hypothetical protein
MNIKKLLFWLITWIGIVLLSWIWITKFDTYANAPSFEKNYVDYLTNKKWDNPNWNETVWDLSKIWIDKNLSIMDNIKNIFYPDLSGQWWWLWNIIKVLGFIVFVVMLVRQWLQYTFQADDENKVASFHFNFSYIFLWWIIFFWATWILWIWLNIWWDWWSSELINKLDTSILFQIFSWIRAGAFFAAIVLLAFTWWRIMSAMDSEEKIKVGRQWILNIIISLLIIKVIDYIYFVAQTPDFKSKATELIVEISKVLLYILWGFFTITLIYYWFNLMFSNGNDESLKKVKSVITAVFLWSLVLFIFFLIIYQITQEFAG